MLIRKMEPKDFDAVHRLMEQLHGLHVQNRPDVYRDADPLDENDFAALLEDTGKIGLVAEIDGTVAGFCDAVMKQPKNSLMQPVKAAYLDDICVDGACRHRGVGKALMQAMGKAAREAGAETLLLTVWSFNHGAVAFYEAMGMSPRNVVMEKKL
jgi:ribosomal protein S18 acetylase RimI-like enzyme